MCALCYNIPYIGVGVCVCACMCVYIYIHMYTHMHGGSYENGAHDGTPRTSRW